MQNYKSPGNDGWTKEFYEAFWIELTDIFIDSVSETKEKGHLSTSQRQDIIRLIKKKKDKEMRFKEKLETHFFIKWDLKTISKALSEKL